MKKILLVLFLLVNCQNANQNLETISQLGLLQYRQNVNINGTFMGIYNADVRVSKLENNGKCGSESVVGVTNNNGKFDISFPRYDGDMVCIKATPKKDGTSRFLTLDTGKEIVWEGDDKFNIMTLSQPSTTNRSSFNVVASPFNRMAMRRTERLAKENSDPIKLKDLVKTANRQIVSQFGLNKSLSKNARVSSIEMAIPDLSEITFDTEDINDPINLKFNVMIGGLHKMGIPEKPDTYEDVVKVVAEYISSGTGSSSSESGEPLLLPRDRKENGGTGLPLSPNNSLSKKVTAAVQSFVVENGGGLNIPPSMVNQIVSQVTVVDKPFFGPVSAPNPEKPPIMEYQSRSFLYTIGSKISITPKYENVMFFYYSNLLPDGLSFNENTGEISGTLEKVGNYNFVINASGKGGDLALNMNIQVVEIPTINITNDTMCRYESRYYSCFYKTGESFVLTPFVKGINNFFYVGVKPYGLEFMKKTGEFVGLPLNSCHDDECIVDLQGEGLGGKTNIVIRFLEMPTLIYETNYVFEDNKIFSLSPQTSKAIKKYELISDLPVGLEMDETGVIRGYPHRMSKTKYDIKIKGTGDGGETIAEFILIRKPILTYLSSFNFSLGSDFEIYPSDSNGLVGYTFDSVLPKDIYFDNLTGKIWGKITSVFNDIWKITGYNDQQKIETSIMISAENNYIIQCNTEFLESLQGDSISPFYCTSLGTNVTGWLFSGELHNGLLTTSNQNNFTISGIALVNGNRSFSVQYMTDYGYSPIFNFSINIKGMPQITNQIKWTVYNNAGIYGYAFQAQDWDLYYQRSDRFYNSGFGRTSTFLNWMDGKMLGINIPNSYEFYSIKIEGVFVPRRNGYYIFSCTGDDAVDLSINNMVICAHYGDHGAAEDGFRTGSYYMETGNSYSFKVRMQEQGGGDALKIKWRKPGSSVWEVDESELGL